jgi:hypothetical protein
MEEALKLVDKKLWLGKQVEVQMSLKLSGPPWDISPCHPSMHAVGNYTVKIRWKQKPI